MLDFPIPISIYSPLLTDIQDAQAGRAPPHFPPPIDLRCPLAQLEHPASAHNHTAHHIDQSHQQAQKACSGFTHNEQNWLDVVLEKYAWHGARGDFPTLTRRRVLIRED